MKDLSVKVCFPFAFLMYFTTCYQTKLSPNFAKCIPLKPQFLSGIDESSEDNFD